MLLRKGDISPEVAECQEMLNRAGASPKLSTDGIFGSGTEAAVMVFQNDQGLSVDGIIGQFTYNALVIASDIEPTPPPSEDPEWLKKEHMKAGQYMAYKTKKLSICLHLTISNGNPLSVIHTWENDSRGAVATEYVVGRKMDNGDQSYNGMVCQTFPQGYWAHHILTERMGFSSSHNIKTNEATVGIEICSWGALKKVGDEFYTLDGRVKIPAEEVTELDKPFRTYKHWHKITDEQIKALRNLIPWIAENEGIDLKDLTYEPEVVNADWFEMDWDAMVVGMGYGLGRKLTSHTCYEYGKFDVFPQPNLMALIKELCGYEN